MPSINVILEHEADGELKEVYRKIHEQRQNEKINRDRDSSPSEGYSSDGDGNRVSQLLDPDGCGL
jgi:hypothetical protein